MKDTTTPDLSQLPPLSTPLPLTQEWVLPGSSPGRAYTRLAEPTCKGCPLSLGQVTAKVWPEGNNVGKIAIVGEGPGKNETKQERPFVGQSGQMLNWLLDRAGLERHELWVTNAALCEPRVVSFTYVADDGVLDDIYIPRKKAMQGSVVKCRSRLIAELAEVMPKVVVVVGNEAMESLTGERGIGSKHGALFPIDLQYLAGKRDKPSWREDDLTYVIPTYHPSHLLRGETRQTAAVIEVLRKAKRIAAGGLREDTGTRLVVSPFVPDPQEALDQLDYWVNKLIAEGEDISLDVETTSERAREATLTVYGFGSSKHRLGCAVSILTWDRGLRRYINHWTAAQFKQLWRALMRLTWSPLKKWYWNYSFDVTVLERYFGHVGGVVGDGIHLHWLIQPDMAHGLGFVCQLYLDIPAWKANFRAAEDAGTATDLDLLLYNAQDCLYTALVIPYLAHFTRFRKNDHLIEHQYLTTEYLARRAANHGLTIHAPTWQLQHDEYASKVAECLEIMRTVIKPAEKEFDAYVYKKRVDRLRESAYRRGVKFKQPKKVPLTAELFNPKSPDHAEWFLFELLALEVTRYTSGGKDKDQTKKRKSVSYKGVLGYIKNPLVKAYVDYAENKANLQTLESMRRHCDEKTLGNEYWWMYPSWNSCGIAGTRFTSKPNCFDEHTELLTPNGWVKIKDVIANEHDVAQFDKDTNKVSFTRPLGTLKRAAKPGELLHVKQKHVDLCVTGEHRLLLETKRGKREDVLARNLVFDRKWIQAGEGVFGHRTEDALFLQLLIMCQADGHWNDYGWMFSFSKARKQARFRALLTKAGVSWSEKVKKDSVAFYWKKSELGTRVHKVLGTEKTLPWWFLDLQRDLAKITFNEVFHWDGFHQGKGLGYLNKNEANVDLVQALGFLLGRRARKRQYTSNLGCTYACVDFAPKGRKYSWTTNCEVENVTATDGFVYCLSVPTTYVVTRRQGKIVVTGQCQNLLKKIRKVVKPRPGRVFVAADAAQIEYRVAALFAGIQELLDIFNQEPFDEDAEPWKKFDPRYDAHAMVAAEVFGSDFLDADMGHKSALRTLVKRVVYGLFYGATPKKIYTTLLEDRRVSINLRAKITIDRITEIAEGFVNRFAEWERWVQREVTLTTKRKYQEFGPFMRRRHWPVRELEENKLRNTPIQLGAGDVCNYIFYNVQIRIDQEGLDAVFFLHGHDACYFDCTEDCAERVRDIINEEFHFLMEWEGKRVHIHGQAGIGKSLADVG